MVSSELLKKHSCSPGSCIMSPLSRVSVMPHFNDILPSAPCRHKKETQEDKHTEPIYMQHHITIKGFMDFAQCEHSEIQSEMGFPAASLWQRTTGGATSKLTSRPSCQTSATAAKLRTLLTAPESRLPAMHLQNNSQRYAPSMSISYSTTSSMPTSCYLPSS